MSARSALLNVYLFRMQLHVTREVAYPVPTVAEDPGERDLEVGNFGCRWSQRPLGSRNGVYENLEAQKAPLTVSGGGRAGRVLAEVPLVRTFAGEGLALLSQLVRWCAGCAGCGAQSREVKATQQASRARELSRWLSLQLDDNLFFKKKHFADERH